MEQHNIFTEMVLTLFRVNGSLIAWGNHQLEPLKLTSARWQIIGAMGRIGAATTNPQIARMMGVSRQGTQKQLNLLLAEGLVEQYINEQHQKSPLYALTEKGQYLFEQTEQIWLQQIPLLIDGINQQELLITLKTLNTLLNNTVALDHLHK
ncbi:MarR family winged helix-turn-helix transcriptional regulator [Neisseria sp. Ec49-e6-T10]|uniref:MarR family winged helix-turn-helix transcriptional regulator n=1 Tax=Neisseria sp. Ec49-e6-T10 TaxID=3140744 RepID=UPI003EB7D107